MLLAQGPQNPKATTDHVEHKRHEKNITKHVFIQRKPPQMNVCLQIKNILIAELLISNEN